MKKKLWKFILTCAICIAVSGCADNQEQNIAIETQNVNQTIIENEIAKQSTIETEISGDMEKHINMELCENVEVDADIEVPNNFSYIANRYKAYVEPFVKEDVWALFGLSKQDMEELSDNHLYKNENTFFEFSDEISGTLYIKTENASCYYMYHSIYLDIEGCSTIENLGEDKELDFLSGKKASEEVIEQLRKIGINNAVVKHIYALPVEYHQCIEKDRLKNGIITEDEMVGERWNDIGGCYEIVLTTEYDDISISEDEYVAQDDSAYNGGKIVVFYSKDGIQRLEVPNQYRIIENDYETVQILEKDKILDIIKKKMDNIILTETYTVTKLELCYFPQIINKKSGDFLLQPIWKVEIKGENVEDMENITYLFKADTGEEIQ